MQARARLSPWPGARRATGIVLVALAATSGTALAEADAEADAGPDADPAPAPSPLLDEPPVRRKDHAGQLGVSLQLPVGFRAVVPYDGEYCGAAGDNGTSNAEVCVGRAPASLDLVVAWGIRPRMELLLELRFGLQRDFGVTAAATGPRPFHWAPGVKVYFSDAGTTKLFSTAQLAVDHTGYDELGGGGKGADVYLRNVNGLQFDLHPSYGLYVFVAEQLAFRRWIYVGVEAGLGIQGRYP